MINLTKTAGTAAQTYSVRIREPDSGRILTVSPGGDAHMHLLEEGLEGFGATELFVETEPYADGTGGHPVTRRFGERYMTITAELAAEQDEGELRRLICAVMNPLHTLEMEVTLGEVTRQISVIPCGRPEFRQANFYSPTEVSLPFLAPDPFYRDAGTKEVQFWQSVPLLTFPMNFWTGAGTAAGYYRTTDTASVWNPGDAACGFDAWLTASGGTVENPALHMGERYIRLQTALSDGETAHIDTRPRHRNLWIDGVRSFTFQRDSEFFLLEPGSNEIRVTADSGAEFLSARLCYTPLYYGI
ncbi:MAG: phage tail family protein [Clostridia bacterium]|nr:phage tail family protein [Clostridia bacterium]